MKIEVARLKNKGLLDIRLITVEELLINGVGALIRDIRD